MKRTKVLFPYYTADIFSSDVRGITSLENFVTSHRSPQPNIAALIQKINNASKNGDKKLKNNLKKKLYYFTPAVLIAKGQRRKYDNIQSFTGIAQIDIDGLDRETAIDLKQYLWESYPNFYCLYLSPSGEGVKGLMRIPIAKDVQDYKEFFQGIEDELDWIGGWDSAPKNPVLPLYLSIDKETFYNSNPIAWSKRGILEDQETYKNLTSETPKYTPKSGDSSEYRSAAYFERITAETFRKKIDNIVDGDGHPRLRSACLVLGSRAGAGYISASNAIDLAHRAVELSHYLKKGLANYKKTASWAVNQGFQRPKYYK